MNFDRNSTFKKKNIELKRMVEEEEKNIGLDNILKELEKNTNFYEFLPYKEAMKLENEPDDILPSPFSPVSNYKKLFEKKEEDKKIFALKSLPNSIERKTTINFTHYQSKALTEMKNSRYTEKKLTKVNEILNLQQNFLCFNKKNSKKILPKINKNVSHSINSLINLN